LKILYPSCFHAEVFLKSKTKASVDEENLLVPFLWQDFGKDRDTTGYSQPLESLLWFEDGKIPHGHRELV
jgi:hypothetical protein